MKEINKNKINSKNFKEAVEYFKSREHIAEARIKQVKEDLANGVNPFLDIDKILEDKLREDNQGN